MCCLLNWMCLCKVTIWPSCSLIVKLNILNWYWSYECENNENTSACMCWILAVHLENDSLLSEMAFPFLSCKAELLYFLNCFRYMWHLLIWHLSGFNCSLNNHCRDSCFGGSKSEDGDRTCPRNVVYYISLHAMGKTPRSPWVQAFILLFPYVIFG